VFILNKHSRMYILDNKYLWRLKQCRYCNKSFIVKDLIFSKHHKSSTRHYHIKCALKIGLLSKEDYNNFMESL